MDLSTEERWIEHKFISRRRPFLRNEKFGEGFVGNLKQRDGRNLINVGRMLLQILSRYLTRVIPLGKGWIKDKRACIRRRD